MSGVAWLIWTLLLLAAGVLTVAHVKTGETEFWGLAGVCLGVALGIAIGAWVS